MICVKIMGGLGNQMYQYAIGRMLAIKNNTDLQYEISYFEDIGARKFMLDNFCTVGEPSNYILIRLFSRKKRVFPLLMHTVREKNSRFDSEVMNLKKKKCFLDGYWGSYKYFDSIRETLRNDFQPKINLSNCELPEKLTLYT